MFKSDIEACGFSNILFAEKLERRIKLKSTSEEVLFLVRVTGVEPARIAAQEPKSCVYANFTIPAG